MKAIVRSSLPLFAVLAALAAACGGDPPAATAGTALAAGTAPGGAPASGVNPVAREVFDSVCFTCHGSTGHGDGPGAAALNPKPRTFVDVAWQDSISDEMVKKVIVLGGVANGKTAVMPAHPQFKGNDEVLSGLVQIVRGFRGK